MTNLIIADDHEMFREGIKHLLSEETDIRIVAEAADKDELIEKLKTHRCDVALMDIAMPGSLEWIDVLKSIRQIKPDMPIIILSMHDEKYYVQQALKMGVSGYIIKQQSSEEVIKCIRKVINGEKYISPMVAQKIVTDLYGDADKLLHDNLSDRELQVMIMLASGKTIKEIAHELSRGVTTISTLRSRILQKMNMKSNLELFDYAKKNGLIQG